MKLTHTQPEVCSGKNINKTQAVGPDGSGQKQAGGAEQTTHLCARTAYICASCFIRFPSRLQVRDLTTADLWLISNVRGEKSPDTNSHRLTYSPITETVVHNDLMKQTQSHKVQKEHTYVDNKTPSP